MTPRKAQAATETLIILGVAFAVLLAVIFSSTDIMNMFSASEKASKAGLMLEDISNAVDLVYSQGEGAKTRVYVTVPADVVSSSVLADRLEIRFRNDTIHRSFSHNITGQLPAEEGNYWVIIEARENDTLIYTEGLGYCGNSDQEGSEQCDGTDLGNQTCISQGYDNGTLVCSPGCVLNTGPCTDCGNGVKEYTESCDSLDMAGLSCADFGFSGGDLLCDSQCSFNTSSCIMAASPFWVLYGANETMPPALKPVQFYSKWTGLGLDDFIFSWNASGTDCGTWHNYSSEDFLAGGWANISVIVPDACGGRTIGFRFYANNTAGRWNVTPIGYLNISSHRRAMLVYFDEGLDEYPQYRIWNGTGLSDAGSATDVNGDVEKWNILRSSPNSSEKILATLDDSDDVNLQVWSGLNWNSPLEASSDANDDNRRQVDVAYEQASSEALAVFVHQDSASRPRYRVWYGSGWTAHQYVANIGSNDLKWLDLNPRPEGEEMVLATLDSGRDVWAQVWNGSGWGNARQLESDAETHTYQCYDAAYESLSGEALVAWANSASDRPRYTAWNGTGWYTNYAQARATGGTDLKWVKLVPDPNSDRIMMGVVNTESGDYVLDVQVWNGTGWGENQQMDSDLETNVDRCFDMAWESVSGRALVVYGSHNSDIPVYRVWNGTWSAERPTGINLGGDQNWIQLASNPESDEILMMAVESQNNNAWVLRWNSTDWAGWDVEQHSNNNEESFHIAYDRN